MYCSTLFLAVAALSAGLARATPINPIPTPTPAQVAACKLRLLAELHAGMSISLPLSCPPAYTSPNLYAGCYWTCPPFQAAGLHPLTSAQTPPPNTDGQTVSCTYTGLEFKPIYCSFSLSSGSNLDTQDLCPRQLTKTQSC